MAKVILNQQELKALLTSPGGGVAQDILRRSRRVENRAKQLCPVNTGRLRASVTHELRTDAGVPVGRIGTNVKYAMYVHEGTGLFGPKKKLIRPKTARALRWRTRGGSVVYARFSRGSKPRPFLREALTAAAD